MSYSRMFATTAFLAGMAAACGDAQQEETRATSAASTSQGDLAPGATRVIEVPVRAHESARVIIRQYGARFTVEHAGDTRSFAGDGKVVWLGSRDSEEDVIETVTVKNTGNLAIQIEVQGSAPTGETAVWCWAGDGCVRKNVDRVEEWEPETLPGKCVPYETDVYFGDRVGICVRR